jgi:uncharacterized protein YndB with AHSA1/START domain
MSERVVTASTTIPAPPDVVFSVIADPRRHPGIDGSGTVRRVLAAPERLSAGARFSMSMRIGAPYRITSTVIEFEEGRRLAWRHPFGHVWRYVLEPAGDGGSVVTESFDYSTLHPLHARALELTGFPGKNRRGIEQSLQRLSEAAQADTGGGTGV